MIVSRLAIENFRGIRKQGSSSPAMRFSLAGTTSANRRSARRSSWPYRPTGRIASRLWRSTTFTTPPIWMVTGNRFRHASKSS